MENTAFDIWLSGRMDFSPEDKNDCFETVKAIVTLTHKARVYGMLSLDEDIASMDDLFLKKALQFAVDSYDPDIIKKLLQTHIVINNYTGRELLKNVIIKEGVIFLIYGYNPAQVRECLSAYLGDEYLQKYSNIAEISEDIRKKITVEEFCEHIRVRRSFPDYEGINFLEETFKKCNDTVIQGLLNDMHTRELLLAVKGSSGYVIKRILNNMSHRNREIFMENCLYLKNISREEIVSAQNRVLDKLKIINN